MSGLLYSDARLVSAESPDSATVIGNYRFPDVAIDSRSLQLLPEGTKDPHAIMLGSVGSDLWAQTTNGHVSFWMLTDRGPNAHVKVEEGERRTLPSPQFTPSILQVRPRKNSLELLQTLPLSGPSGVRAVGVAAHKGDESTFDFSGKKEHKRSAVGIDPEGMVRTKSGEFWVAEEYGPSLLKIDANGIILQRFVPFGTVWGKTDYQILPMLPAIYAKRQVNHGFEGLAMSIDERLLYLVMQSPLANPGALAAKSARNCRILVFDTKALQCVAEYVYPLEVETKKDGSAKTPDTCLSAAAWINRDQLLLVERTGKRSWIYSFDMSTATNLLPTRWHAADGTDGLDTLESLADCESEGLRPGKKSLLLDLSKFSEVPPKIEGLAVVDNHTIAVANDNDFDFNGYDDEGKAISAGQESRIIVLKLDRELYPTPGQSHLPLTQH